jgi:hypothetical protein
MDKLNPFFAATALALAVVGGCQQRETPEPRARAAEQADATDLDLGRSIGADKKIADKTRSFRPTDTIYASIDTKGASAGTPVGVVWKYQDGQIVHTESTTIATDGKEHTEFHLDKPSGFPAGDYTVEITVGRETKRQSFTVK